jgi:hypothetical protein
VATTEVATERSAITSVVQMYIDGAATGDVGKLEDAFHSEAWMFGSIGGQRFDMPITKMIAITKKQPLDSDGSFKARIASIEQLENTATAVVEEEGCWGGVSFTDFFSLAKIDGSWKIVNKTFAHTGGEMPAS